MIEGCRGGGTSNGERNVDRIHKLYGLEVRKDPVTTRSSRANLD